ncbi:MAG: hypothetical protein ABID09_05620 [Candidatus Omnitrophota bacterium]
MKLIYTFFAITIIAIVILLSLTFYLFEKGKHLSSIYEMEMGGEKVGYVKVDRYRTEDKVTYKSTTVKPKDIRCKIVREKIVFEKNDFRLASYVSECKNSGSIAEGIYIRNRGETYDYVTKIWAKFGAISNVDHPGDNSVYERRSLLTYITLIDRYNFNKGGAQKFNALYINHDLFPPAQGKVVLTSIRDEYITVKGRKIKTEVLVLGDRNLPEGFIWVAKKGRNIAQFELKSEGVLIKEVAGLPDIDIKNFIKEPTDKYYSKSVLIPSRDIALAGTLDIPNKDGKLPAVVLISGEGHYDRDNAGLFACLSDDLAGRGFITLRYDRRGIGQSQGESASVGITDDITDYKSALSFLAQNKKVDADKIFIVAHKDACLYLLGIDFTDHPIRGAVMLNATRPAPLVDLNDGYLSEKVKMIAAFDPGFTERLEHMKSETMNMVNTTKQDHSIVQGKIMPVKRMRELTHFKPLQATGGPGFPVLIIYGKFDETASKEIIGNMDKGLKNPDIKGNKTLYFRNLGRFLGAIENERGRIEYYKTDKEVLQSVSDWIKERSAKEEPVIKRNEPAVNVAEIVPDNLTKP